MFGGRENKEGQNCLENKKRKKEKKGNEKERSFRERLFWQV